MDLWFEKEVRRGNRGESRMFRYADDFVCAFAHRHEADAFLGALSERLRQFGLELAADKTRMMRFGRNGGDYNGRFDFLGFEFSWGISRTGKRLIQRRTSRKKLRGAVERFTEWIKGSRSQPVEQLMSTAAQKYRGHGSYYGVIGNSQSLGDFYEQTTASLFKWLNRRSQKKSYTWSGFRRLLERFGVCRPRIMEKAGGRDWSSNLAKSVPAEGGVNLFGAHYVSCRA